MGTDVEGFQIWLLTSCNVTVACTVLKWSAGMGLYNAMLCLAVPGYQIPSR